jgi:hypothetical protein
MPDYAPHVEASAVISVDALNEIVLATSASPSCASAECTSKTVIRRIQNPTGPYQRLSMSLTAHTVLGGNTFNLDSQQGVQVVFNGDGMQIAAVVSDVECTPDEESQVTACSVQLASDRLTGVSAGTLEIKAVWRQVHSVYLPISVMNDVTTVSEMSLSQPSSNTISGVVGTEIQIEVDAGFDDGTQLQSGLSWLPVTDYLTFSVSDSSIFTADANGLVTILANSVGQEPVVLTVASTRDAK